MRLSTSRFSVLGAAICLVGAAASSCSLIATEGNCDGVGYYPLDVTIRNSAGDSIALGATATLDDGSYHEVDSTLYNALEIPVANERGGRIYTIHVTKPLYTDAVAHARAPGGGCVTNAVTDTVKIVLTPAPGAPGVRSIHLLPPHVLLDRATGKVSYRCRAVSGFVTVTAVSVADSSVSASATIAVQGHPATTGDPPCA
jgi:hypothetical protein